ncbi:helix-turn-helix domain-containing protein [Mesorhizobium denitrificans]|uniref:DNA-binding protein n=1 Tax=Mesorhizobium denitrificans TaxID=2294114 RepID=A0A371XJ33_9HYPH|nr:helix-turn-helix domain-containing protein [Mesorhizobium denitrificans]RFC69227.1 DNA-binding protein [Mesorhizobium denitrificans]
MAGHRLDRRKIKRHHSYTVEEAARTIGAARSTVRRWLDNGLPAIRERKPFLILGKDLADFMAGKARPKRSCPTGTCYCVKCREPRWPDGEMAEFVPINARSGNLRALCPACGTLMHRRTSMKQLEAIRAFLDVAIVERQPRLNDSG